MSSEAAPPPRDLEAERAVIAGLLAGADLDSLSLRIEAFPDHQPLVSVISERIDRGQRVDRETLRAELPDLAQLVDELPVHDPRGFAKHVEIVGDLDKLRRLIDASHEIAGIVEAQDQRWWNAHAFRGRISSDRLRLRRRR